MKLNILIILLMATTFQIKLKAQSDVIRIINSSNELQKKGHLAESIDSVKKLCLLMPEANNQVLYYDIAKKFSLLNITDSSFYYLSKSFQSEIPIEVLAEESFYNLIQDSRWQEIEEKAISQYEAQKGRLKNKELVLNLLRLQLKDQAFFYEIELLENNYDEIAYLKYIIWDLKGIINRENQQILSTIIENDGWPNPEFLPREAYMGAFFVAQHCLDLDKQISFFESCKSAAYTDTTSLQNLAYLEDRVNLRKGLPQIYGTQVEKNLDSGEYFVSPIIEPEKVNERRSKVGLGKIENYLKNWNITWDVEKQKKINNSMLKKGKE